MLGSTYEGASLNKIKDTITKDKWREIGNKAKEALQQIHRSGYVHGDIAERNIVYDTRTGKVTLIDLGMTTKCGNRADHEDEQQQLEQIFNT